MQQFEDLQLDEGVGLIKRFAKKRVQISKIWRNCIKIAVFGCKFFLSKALMRYSDDIKELLVDSLKTYLNLCNTDALSQEFVTSVRNITNLADAAGLCAMCEVIHKEAADKLRHFAIEMYIRALTTDMNELERLKHVNEEDKVKFTTSRLANTFTNLADLLDDHVKVARECILTAFSLEPTKDRLKRIENLALRSGFPVLDTGQEWKCRLHPPALPSDDIAWVCPECGDWMCKPELTAPLQMNMALHEALQESVLGISEALCDDLVVCLSNPRYQILSWLLTWGDLYRLCIMYLNDPEKTKNFVTELKFVDVDYSMFQHIKREPVDEYTGIEKGYEQYLDLNFNPDEETSSVSEDSISHDKYLGMGSDGTGEPYLPLPQTRSDPNTLRSLRMFRPNLKRKKEDLDSSTPGKRAAIDPAISNSSLSIGSYTSSQNSQTTSSFGASTSNCYIPSPHGIIYPAQYSAALNYSAGSSVPTSTSSLYEYATRTLNIFDQSASQGSAVKSNNSALELIVNKNANIRCYPPKSELHPDTNSSTMGGNNSVFNANLTSGTSTEYVSNIIKSNLTFGMPKLSSKTSPISYSAELKKQGANYLHNSPKNTKKQVFSHNAQELDSLLKEVADEMEMDTLKLDTDSKNGVAATLPELGGQVANKQNQLIPVPQESHSPLMKSQQGMFSPNGTKDDCKMKLKNSPEIHKNPGEPLITTIAALSKKLNLTKTNHHGLMQKALKVEIARLDLESVQAKWSRLSQLGKKILTMPIKMSTSTQDYLKPKVGLHPSKFQEIQTQSNKVLNESPLECDLQSRVYPLSDQEISTPLQTLLPSRNLPVMQPTHQSKVLSLMSHCQKEQYSTQKVQFLETNREMPADTLERHSSKFVKDQKQILDRQESASIPQTNSPVASQTFLNQLQNQNQALDLELKMKSASMILVKSRENLLPLGPNSPEKSDGKTSSQKELGQHHISVKQERSQTSPTQVVSLKTMPQITMDCDKDKNPMVQKEENKKTDSDGTEAINISSSIYCEDNSFKSSQLKTDSRMMAEHEPTETVIEYFPPDENLNYQECTVLSKNQNCKGSLTDKSGCVEGKQSNSNKEDSNLSIDRKNVNSELPCDTIINIDRDESDSVDVLVHIKELLKDMRKCLSDKEIDKSVYESIFMQTNENSSSNINTFLIENTSSKEQITKSLSTLGSEDSHMSAKTKLSIRRHARRVEKESKEENEDSSDIDKENFNTPSKGLIMNISSNSNIEFLNNNSTSIIESYSLTQLGGNCGRSSKYLKKYTNTHKRKHQNVPCFKLDQENSNHQNKKELVAICPSSSISSIIRNDSVDYLNHLKRLLRDTIERKRRITCHFQKFKRSSPLADNSNRRDRELNEQSSTNGTNVKKKYTIKLPNSKKKIRFSIRPLDQTSEKKRTNTSILNNVPGLNDLSEVRPHMIEQVINVVQVSSTRSSTVSNQNIQTSTQVTPHIQRIGQPKLSEQKTDSCPEESQSSSNTVPTTIQTPKPSTSQSPTLINILNSQIKPSQKSASSTRPTPYINILSQQIIKQPNQPVRKSSKPPANVPTQTATVIKVESEGNIESVKPVSSNVKVVASTTASETVSTTTASQGSTILQFICKSSSLPKFQQAFGKTVYQATGSDDGNSENTTPPVSENTEQPPPTTTIETKKVATKTVPVSVQPIAGNVIFRGQVPVGQTVSLIPPGGNTRQLFRITGSTHEQISLVKETVIQNKMSALLAAALQGKPKITEQNGELVEEYSATRITLCRPGTVPNATRIVKPVQLQIPANVIKTPQTNMSLTTLEQLREFDMVYKQVKERSNNPAQPETTVVTSQESPQQRISFTYVNQVQKYTQLSPVVVVSSYNPIQQSSSPSLSVSSQSSSSGCLTQATTVAVPKVSVKSSKGKSIKSSATKTAPSAVPTIPKPQQKPQEDEHTTQRIFDILAEYAEQLRNSPDLNNKPAPRRRSNPPTNPSTSSSNSSSNKKKKKKSSNTSSNLVEADNEDLTMGSEDSSGGNIVQLSMTDEEQSQSASITPPDTNLEPASSNTTSRPLIVTDASNQPRNVIIADSSVGEALKMPNTTLIMPGSYIMPVSVVKGSQQIAVVSGGSKILTTVPARSGQNMLLFQSFVNQNKKTGGISTVKYSTIQPFSGISSQSVTGVTAQPPVVLPSNSVATVTLGQPITLKKMEDSERSNNTELLLTISQPSETIKIDKSPDIPQPDSSTNLSNDGSDSKMDGSNQTSHISNDNVFNNIQKTSSVATSVIASVVKKEEDGRAEIVSTMDTGNIKVEQNKQAERIESVLVNASTSNGPMLSHTNPRYRKSCEGVESTTQTVKEFNHNSSKVPISGTKIYKNNAIYYAIRTKKPTSKKLDSDMQKQAAMERELRLQKSLSEECEDLGVDEPSTSDLFPEADLLFDSNHSPSYEQTGQKIQVAEVKAKASMNLFSDDENSGPMRNDLFDYVEYHPVEAGVDQITDNNVVNESATSCDDTTLLPNCGTMSEVTLNSPISPEYTDNSHTINKYKYKYTNRKKGEKNVKTQPEAWSEVTSSEDALELTKEEDTPIAIQEETVIDNTLMEVEAISDGRQSPDKDQLKCPHHTVLDRGMRRTSRKPCSCFNGSRSPSVSNIKKRLNSAKPQAPIPSKKPLVIKKR